MKKKSIIAMMMALGLAGSMALPTQAASVQCIGGKGMVKGWVIMKDCPIISLPNCNQPEVEEKPDMPDNSQPEVEEKPDMPESNQPEVEEKPDAPENNQPEVESPEQDNAGSNTPEKPGESESQPDNTELSYAEQIVKLVNEERAKAGLSALELDTAISSAATIRANEITGLFSHTRPDGRTFSTVLTDNGIRFNGAGENIAWGQKSPEQVMNAWMNSEGHRANILNAKYTKIGVGHYQSASGTNYWAQLFTY